MERLQKYIAESGYCSRRKAEELMKQGKVTVDGVVVKTLGTKVTGKEKIVIDGEQLKREIKEYYLLNKPRGVLSTTSDDKNRNTVVDLINTTSRIYPVGRLDYDTTGVLLLTNDGEFADILMHPKDEVDKVYVVKISGIIKGDAINRLKNGVVIDGIKTEKCRVKLRSVNKTKNTSIVEITIHEGRNHQVKKMFKAAGFEVLKLKRERVGIFNLRGLESGEYRRLTKKEIKIVYSLKK